MENLQFQFQGGHRQPGAGAQLVGVVSSGNLEVLLERCALDGQCEVQVSTAARGFAPVWQAVLNDFHARWQLCDVRLSINDMGATPAVVALRLDQVVQAACDGAGA